MLGRDLDWPARELRCSHTLLAREFRRRFGCSIGDYVRRLRIEFACRELAISDVPLYEIAFAAGFSDHSHFARTFKRATGMTPGAYRAASKEV